MLSGVMGYFYGGRLVSAPFAHCAVPCLRDPHKSSPSPTLPYATHLVLTSSTIIALTITSRMCQATGGHSRLSVEGHLRSRVSTFEKRNRWIRESL